MQQPPDASFVSILAKANCVGHGSRPGSGHAGILACRLVDPKRHSTPSKATGCYSKSATTPLSFTKNSQLAAGYGRDRTHVLGEGMRALPHQRNLHHQKHALSNGRKCWRHPKGEPVKSLVIRFAVATAWNWERYRVHGTALLGLAV